MARSPRSTPPGVAEAPATFIPASVDPMAKMPMFAPVTGPRLTPEEAPGKPEGWQPHRPDRTAATRQKPFRMVSPFQPSGDQPAAIAELVEQAEAGERDQVLLGVTGSGKTFTMAKVI